MKRHDYFDFIKTVRLITWLFLLLITSAHSQNRETVIAKPVYVVDLNGMINPGTAGLLNHAIQTATAADASALIIRINTPGGLLSSTRDMISAIDQSSIPIIGYVGPDGASATSAGAFILLATHIAVMNRGTNVGASSPVAGNGADIGGTMGKKVLNDSQAFMRSIASSRNRNVDIAEQFVAQALSLSADDALKNGAVDLVISEFLQLLPAINGRIIQFHGAPVALAVTGSPQQVELRFIDRLLKYIADPQIAHLLISLGMVAIYIELLAPGITFPGIVGVISIILGLVGIQTLPVNIGFLALLFLGLVLMLSEYFIASFGVLGIGGAIAFAVGSINLFNMPLSTEYKNAILSAVIAVSCAVLLTTFLISRSLRPSTPKKLIGHTGEAMVNFDKSGYVLINGQRWAAQTDKVLHHGDKIEVISQNKDGHLVVKKLDN